MSDPVRLWSPEHRDRLQRHADGVRGDVERLLTAVAGEPVHVALVYWPATRLDIMASIKAGEEAGALDALELTCESLAGPTLAALFTKPRGTA